MATGSISLKMALTGEDKLTGIIQKTNSQMNKFRKGTSSAGKQATSSFATIKGKISGVNNKFTELNSKIALLKQGFAVLKAVAEHAISGEIANNAEKVFAQISGGTAKASKAMEKLRDVSRGIVDDTSLQQFAIKMTMAGVEMAHTAKIVKTATDISLVSGENALVVAEKLKNMVLQGREGDFQKLGVTIKINDALKEQAAAQGITVEQMTKNEQVTARLDIITNKLSTSFDAAGINTQTLSDRLQGLKTAADNAESSLQQMLAAKFEERTAIEGTKAAIGVQVKMMIEAGRTSTQMALDLARDFNVPFDQTAAVIKDISEFKLGTWRSEEVIAGQITQSVLEMALKKDDELKMKKQKSATEFLKWEKGNRDRTASEITKKKKEIQDLTLTLMKDQLFGEAHLADVHQLRIKEIGVEISVLQGKMTKAGGIFEKAKLSLEGLLAGKAKKEREKAEKERAATARKSAAASRRSREESAKKEALSINKIEANTIGIGLQIKIDGHRREGHLEAAHRLEIKKATLKNESDIENEFKLGAEKKANMLMVQRKSEIDMIVRHGSEVEKVQEAADKILFDASKKAGEDAAAEKQKNMEILIGQTKEYADALNMLQGPLVSLVDHQMGASEELKVFGGALGATSAAANVFVAEADASKTATENFTKSLPGAISAGGSAASAFVKQTKHKALIQGGFEAASSIASFATGNVIGGAGHAASAALFFALAGKSAQGGKSSGSSGTKTGALSSGGGGSSGLSASGKGSSVVVNVQGFALGSAKEMGAKMAQTIDQARDTGLNSSEV
tara:strand:- start:5679 stop:8063 length:2385 start_codon:yes stop_codon:yes gene_type:complete